METLLVIAALVCAIWVMGWISEKLAEKREEKKSAGLMPKLDEILGRAVLIEQTEPRSSFDQTRKMFNNSLAVIREGERNISICPKCGDTLTVRNTGYYGKILGCPNYPRCRFLIKSSELNLTEIESLSLD